MKRVFVFITAFFMSFHLYAESVKTGVLNVFTDLPDAIIFVDGLEAGTESVVRLPLQVGEHYVRVTFEDKLVYAEKVEIFENRSSTVVSEHFVDIITKTPSRGAIEREAARLRESRGKMGLGVVFNPELQTAASFKYWAYKHVGFQALGLGGIQGSNNAGMFGGRVFVSPADKIYKDDILTGHVFFGGGKFWKNVGDDLDGKGYSEMGLAIEANLGKAFEDFMGLLFSGHTELDLDKESGEVLLAGLGLYILSTISHTSVELNMIKPEGEPVTSGVSVGFHVYF